MHTTLERKQGELPYFTRRRHLITQRGINMGVIPASGPSIRAGGQPASIVWSNVFTQEVLPLLPPPRSFSIQRAYQSLRNGMKIVARGLCVIFNLWGRWRLWTGPIWDRYWSKLVVFKANQPDSNLNFIFSHFMASVSKNVNVEVFSSIGCN